MLKEHKNLKIFDLLSLQLSSNVEDDILEFMGNPNDALCWFTVEILGEEEDFSSANTLARKCLELGAAENEHVLIEVNS